MKVEVHFYAQLRDVAGVSRLEVELPHDATVAELLARVYEMNPALRIHDNTLLIGAGVEFVDRQYRLRPGEEVAVMPPVQGG